MRLDLGLLFSLLLGLVAGGGVGEVALRLTSRRRGRQSANIAAAGAVIGGLLGGVVQFLLLYAQLAGGRGVPGLTLDLIFRRLTGDLGLLIFVGLVAAAVYGRFKLRS